MKKNSTFICFLLLTSCVVAQKKTMSHEVYGIWKKIDQQRISNDGKWVSYITLSNTEGDPNLYLWNAISASTTIFPRGTEGRFTEDNAFLIFKIKQPLDSLKAKRRKKVKDEDLPKDSLGIYTLATGDLKKVANVKSFNLPQKWSGFVAYQLEADKPEKEDKNGKNATKDSTVAPKPKLKKEDKDNGSKVILYNLASSKQDTFFYALEYTFAKRGKRFLVADTGKDSVVTAAVHVFDCDKNALKTIFRKKGKYKQISLDENGNQVAFIADVDTTKERVRPFNLMFWTDNMDSAKIIARSNTNFGFIKNGLVSENAKPNFSEDGSKLYFGVAQQPILNDTTLLPEEIVSVEVWSHTDTKLHTQQKVQLENERKRSYDAVYHIANQQVISLSDSEMPEISYTDSKNSDVAIGYTDEPYARAATWEGYAGRDYYLVDLKTGNRTPIAQKVRGVARISPFGKYVYWYNALDSVWLAYSILNKKTIRLTDNKTVPFYEEENDVPDNPSSYNHLAWMRDDKSILIYDRYDVWQIDPLSIGNAKRLTEGRAQKNVYRYVKLDDEERFIEPNARLLLHVFNETDKKEGYAYLDLTAKTVSGEFLDNFKFSERVLKAKDALGMVLSKQNFQTFPDLLYATDLTKTQRISDVNPQQNEYNWGSIELVEWTSLDGQKLKGMLVKPADFDPKKKYPMIVNFYEKSSDDLNNYRTLEPLRSQINYTFYSNRGYLVFNPDIPYRTGYPGESCLNSVVAGVTHLIDKGFVDEKNVAVQGHSWGGYQVAYLITKTNMFKCAGSGAPVVNMISAYGGIRWETGVMRMFQYEHTQSRIGGSLWEYPLRFLENSPIFSVDKVQTPVLILHNDKDGAVPWYQGIEFFGALRRLNKPVWLLNYNDEPHWPVKVQNRVDYQIRMQQFFDYYLKGAPMPRWMQRGVPAIEKGILQGYELGEEEKK